jgi:hypothetical protein
VLVILGALIAAAALAAYGYLRRERLGRAGLGFAALRWVAIACLVLLVFDPPWAGTAAALPPTVLLDRSLSMGVRGGRWEQARDSAAALAGTAGRVLGFGRTVGPMADSLPGDGSTMLRDALVTARAIGGPIWVVTDGEITDAAALPAGALDGVRLVVLPRDSVPGAAVVGLRTPTMVRAGDSIAVAVTLATWGRIAADSARVEIDIDGRRALVRSVALPPSPATLQRRLPVPSSALRTGDHVIEARIAVTGDAEPADDARVRIVTVTAAPPLVVIVDPASWEGRFLFETVQDVAGMPTRGFARVGFGRWIDLAASRPVTADGVRAAAAGSALLVVHGSADITRGLSRAGPVWEWGVGGRGEQVLPGDWYVVDQVPPSGLLAALARVEWDSVPPLASLQASPSDTGQAVLLARRGRRGEPRAVVVGAVERGRPTLRTLASGFSRWSLRGGASREALRALVAAGADWLLASAGPEARSPLDADREVTRGTPVSFRWRGAAVPDSLHVTVMSGQDERDLVLRFDATGRAGLLLPVGVHAWSTPGLGASGTVAVEGYSEEFPPGPVTVASVESAPPRASGPPSRVRDHWWMYLLVLVALVGEWAWRQRRGLP